MGSEIRHTCAAEDGQVLGLIIFCRYRCAGHSHGCRVCWARAQAAPITGFVGLSEACDFAGMQIDSASSRSNAARDPLNQDCIISNCFFTEVDDLKPIIIRAIPENGQDGRGQAFKQGPSNEDEFVEDLVDKRISPRLRYKPKVTCCL